MIQKDINIDEIVRLLINGDVVVVNDGQKKEVQEKLRQIKTNCTIVLSQLKNN